jgi:transcriptional regulator with XRE-family HTH domain
MVIRDEIRGMFDTEDEGFVVSASRPDLDKPVDQETVRAHIAGRLRTLRARAGLSQARLAKHIGITPSQIHFYEHGQNAIGAAVLFSLARGLGCTIADFYAGLDPKIIGADRDLDDGPDPGPKTMLGALQSLSPEVQSMVLALIETLAQEAAGQAPSARG